MSEPVQERELEYLYGADKIQHLLARHLKGRTMFLKGQDPPAEALVHEFDLNNRILLESKKVTLEPEMKLQLFRILGRYIELHCEVLKKSGENLYNIQVNSAAIAKKERSNMRIPLSPDQAHITNILASRHTIDTDTLTIPTSVKVGFGEYEQILKRDFEIVKIDAFGKRGTWLDQVKKHGKSIYIPATEDPHSYRPQDDRCLDAAALLGNKLQEKIIEYRNHKVKAEAIVPVIYMTHDRSPIPIGYIHVQGKKGTFPEGTLDKLYNASADMVEKIRGSNTVMIKEKQQVVNVSRGGIRVRITHEELRTYLARQNGFTFDLVFRMQAPITLFGQIRSQKKMASGELLLGVQIAGNSDEASYKRFLGNVDKMEQEAKARLEAKKQQLKRARS
ncbi:MAG: hypothetical protein CMN76_19645 [Spirochaetaceae bacterium]|nr:hypothetical protein [Spirochaetaceae bacterium]|tara:strand:+ start:31946 stop:33118 length:1173 start_codon:yes stop_codon:yes gene_type:complete